MTGRGSGSGLRPRPGGTEATESQSDDVVLVEADSHNNNGPGRVEARGPEAAGDSDSRPFSVGVPSPNFNIQESVFYSHHYYEKVKGDDGKPTFQAKCLICRVEKKTETVLKTSDNNTKGLITHLTSKHVEYVEKWQKQRDEVDKMRKETREKRDKVVDSSRQTKLFSSGSDNTMRVEPAIDRGLQDRYDQARVMFAARSMCSFYALQHTELFAKALLPKTHHRIKHKTLKVISQQTGKEADKMRIDIFNIILGAKEFCQTFNFTSDMWKSANVHSFVSLTVHFLTLDWDYIKLVPYSEYFGPKKHTGENILLSLNAMMAEFGIDGPQFTKYILLDNASNNRKAMKLSQDFTPVWCCIHTLQLAIGDTFKIKMGQISVKKIVAKCKEVSKLVRRSEANRDALKEACVTENIPYIMPHKPGATRWNSKEKNISHVLVLQPALQKLAITDTTDTWEKDVPTAREFETAASMQKCLNPLKVATLCWEADRVPTMHTVIRELWNIKTKLDQLSATGQNVKMFARNLQRNVNKRFKNCGSENLLFSCAHFLDPDLRGIILKEFPRAYERTVAEIRRRCLEYDSEPAPRPQAEALVDGNEDVAALTPAQQLKRRRISGNRAAPPPTLSRIDLELTNYESFTDDSGADPSRICEWWRNNRGRFPLLERLAREILSIPASSASSERVFSAGTRACSARRYNLSPKRISDLMILNVNEEDVNCYRDRHGIKKLYHGNVKKIVDVEFCDDQRMIEETIEPPLFEPEEPLDEFCEVESDLSEEEDEGQPDSDNEDTNTESEEEME